MQTMINLGIWENKNYHFDWEEILLEFGLMDFADDYHI